MAPYVIPSVITRNDDARYEGQHAVADAFEPLFDLPTAEELASLAYLAATRDLLLPKLMSGEIRVKRPRRSCER